MGQINRYRVPQESGIELPVEFTSQAGLLVNTFDDKWELDPTGKGKTVDVTWLHTFEINSKLRSILLDTLIYYAETKAASTVSTIKFAVFDAFPDDNISISGFKRRWQSMRASNKKTLKGFLNTCVKKLIHKYMKKFYDVTSKYKYKAKFNALHPTKGRLTDYEYDSILQNLRVLCEEIPTQSPHDLQYYQITYSKSAPVFNDHKKLLAYRSLVQMARRPKQISMLKWCDILPIGVSFQSKDVNFEPLYTGIKSLHCRIFKIKQYYNENNFRATSEKWTIPLSESFSSLILKYRALYVSGLTLTLENVGIDNPKIEAQKLIKYCPVFPDQELFKLNYKNKNILSSLTNEKSQIFHMSEGTIKQCDSIYGRGLSERHSKVIGTNNRLRHTWLCNAALEGKALSDISKITNVTLPAARYYLQLGLKERQFIDENYAANDLLREAFNPKPFANSDDILIESETVGAIGVEKYAPTCQTCEHKLRLVRPIPCYGCSNFIPLLEADHESILEQATSKRDFLEKFGNTDIISGSTVRLDKAIAYIKLTIAKCHETKLLRSGLKEK